jgi:hypothetical protein
VHEKYGALVSWGAREKVGECVSNMGGARVKWGAHE